MPHYFIVDQSSLDEIGSRLGQVREDAMQTLEEMLEGDDEALNDLVVIYGDIIPSITKITVHLDDPNGPS